MDIVEFGYFLIENWHTQRGKIQTNILIYSSLSSVVPCGTYCEATTIAMYCLNITLS